MKSTHPSSEETFYKAMHDLWITFVGRIFHVAVAAREADQLELLLPKRKERHK